MVYTTWLHSKLKELSYVTSYNERGFLKIDIHPSLMCIIYTKPDNHPYPNAYPFFADTDTKFLF